MHQLGGLVFTARILPMTLTGRGQAPRRMLVMISSTPADTIDVDVRQITTGANHATAHGLGIDQLQSVLLALDYNGRDVFNPRYWNN